MPEASCEALLLRELCERWTACTRGRNTMCLSVTAFTAPFSTEVMQYTYNEARELFGTPLCHKAVGAGFASEGSHLLHCGNADHARPRMPCCGRRPTARRLITELTCVYATECSHVLVSSFHTCEQLAIQPLTPCSNCHNCPVACRVFLKSITDHMSAVVGVVLASLALFPAATMGMQPSCSRRLPAHELNASKHIR